MRISSSLPRPTRVAGSSESRTCNREPSIFAPALSASSWSSSSESRPAAVGSPARPRGAFFKPTPTSNTRSRLSISCGVFIRYKCLDERMSLEDSLSSDAHYTLFDLSARKAGRNINDARAPKLPKLVGKETPQALDGRAEIPDHG